ncbi:MAG: DUF1217 domain-containing protein [Roseiarcus sp.]
MTTTLSSYLSIENNLANYQTMTANEPQVKGATQYYETNIGKVSTIAEFVSNYRLLSYALDAYGLGKYVDDTALVKQVLEQGTSSAKALANTLTDPNWKTFANAFNFSNTGSSSPTSSTSVATTTSDYIEQQLEQGQGQSDPGVQLALYFKRVAPTVTNGYGIIGDQNLLDVADTIFGLSTSINSSQVDAEAKEITNLMPLSELQDPTKLNNLIERFAANYDADYGPGSTDPSGLTVTDDNSTSASTTLAANSILAGVVSSNASELSGLLPTATFSASLLSAVQGLSFGG